ncbi:MAG: ATP-dependent protease La Type I [uncultured Solirubrobacteraceae bacterium]|uniref:Lon protease n=1 Tax=uncultured Solirubrobacteraceae bacterium TaxID=1162706 RepID=A0A6J4SXP5_9ACTN|nr:MAG: ATP-dependent protease La Type I [uncultured Solirubrobacteraceae bacterium]
MSEERRVLPLRGTVAFPDTVVPLAIGQPRSIELVNDALTSDRTIVMLAAKDAEMEEPPPDQLHGVGVMGSIAQMMKAPDGTLRILVQVGARVHVTKWVRETPYLVAEVAEEPDVVEESPELTALTRSVQQTFGQIVEALPYLPEELQIAVQNLEDPSVLSHLIAGALRLPVDRKQALLEERDVGKRLRRLLEILQQELEVVQIGSRIQSEVQGELDRGQREYILRQQLKAIQEELGERDPAEAEVDELREMLSKLSLPEEIDKQVERELSRLERVPQASPEHGVIRTWLEWISTLPWSNRTDDDLDLAHAREVLDDDHYGLEAVKDRILEFLAVRSLKPDARGSIICFAGPPGVGKTSLGKSIARALGREFERISVGGVRDEAEIRGHRRTYIGSLPGVIVRAMRDAGTLNPLFMIDEIDKMGSDFRGDPASAMLEVLDPEQNSTFRDHYLDVPLDLSNVMFIATANNLDTIPGPLLDRMEIIQIAGYTEEEKLQIAKRYLVPRQVERNGLKKSRITISDRSLRIVIRDYTREAGVRSLEREIGTICRKVARTVAEGTDGGKRTTISEAKVRELLGRRKVFSEARRRTRDAGVATGLAWTPVGGDVLFVEASAVPGTGKLTITGQLGDVMRESVQAALTFVRGNSDVEPTWFAEHDLHVHVPAGAIPKDGPSAGVTLVTALTSALTGRCVRSDVAMTGEVTLTGDVLPIGGLKEKALAAQRLGIKHVIAPELNEADIEEIPEHLREQLEFHFVAHVEEVLAVALEDGRVASRARQASDLRERNGEEDQGGQGNGRHRGRRRDTVRAATDPG